MGTLRVHPVLERKIKQMYIKMRKDYPRKRITIVNITANIDFDEQEMRKKLLERKRRCNRYLFKS
jgi:hypothetical protein